MKFCVIVLLAVFDLPGYGQEPPPGWQPNAADRKAIERSLDRQTIPEDFDGDLAFGPDDQADRWAIDYIRNLQSQSGKLKFTVKQSDELGRLSFEFRVKRVRLRSSLAESKLRLRRSLAARPPDFAAALAEAESQVKTLRELYAAAIDTIRASYETLSPEQRRRLDVVPAP